MTYLITSELLFDELGILCINAEFKRTLIDEKKYMDDKDIAKIIKAAKSIIKHCDKITGSRCKNGNNK